MKVGAIGYRAPVAECSDVEKNAICKPGQADFMSCKYIGKDPKALAKYAQEFINKAKVTCQIKRTGTTYARPAPDCSSLTQRRACPQLSTDPVGCEQFETAIDLAKSFK